MGFRIFKQLPRLIYGRDSLNRVSELLPLNIKDKVVFIVHDKKLPKAIINKLKKIKNTEFYSYDATQSEPYTSNVNFLRDQIIEKKFDIGALIGLGGGSTLDLAKGVSILLKNNGIIDSFQGWDLVSNPGIFKIGIPTIFGSGSEASRTAVFNNGTKKQGVNSDFSMFDAIIIDPNLSTSVSTEQKMYTAMDCYIHCVESLEGTYINQISKGFAEKALEYCNEYFNDLQDEELIAVASYYGGVSIVNSEVGICHALSYGISIELGIRHGLANCIVFNVLDDYYGRHVTRFKKILKQHKIVLPKLFHGEIENDMLNRMIDQTFLMVKPLENALGPEWKTVLTKQKIRSLYLKM